MILCCVTDRRRLGLSVPELLARIQWLAAAGVDYIQLRERDLTDRGLLDLASAAVRAVSGTGARVLVNDRADIAVAAAAHGVHLREDSPPAARVRALARSPLIVGRSVHSAAAVRAASGAYDYLLFGTVFSSRGKPTGHPVAGLDALRGACAAADAPVLAIGGIDAGRAAAVAGTGAAGIAAVDALLGADSAKDARRRADGLRRMFDSGSRVV